MLITSGALSGEDYLRRLADTLGLTLDSLDGVRRAQCPVDDDRLIESVAAGMLPLKVGGELYLVVAPRGTAARRIVALIDDRPDLARRIRFTTSARLSSFVFRHANGAITARAVNRLKISWPLLSAAARERSITAPLSIFGFLAFVAAFVAPERTMLASEILLAAVFLAWLCLRLASLVIEWRNSDPPSRLRDDELPVYTVISALYREASSVGGLLTAIERLDYPGIMAQTPRRLGFSRLDRTCPPRIVVDRLGAAAHTTALAFIVTRSLARALSAHRLALQVGENRTRAGTKLAARQQRIAVLVPIGTASHATARRRPRGPTRPESGNRGYIYFRSSAADSSGFRSSLNGATKRPCLSMR